MNKREEWEKLQREDPKLAEVVKLHAKIFGKPQEIRITYHRSIQEEK